MQPEKPVGVDSLTSDVVRVARIVPRTIAEGPGERFAIWVQGCSIRCPGCFNPQFWGARGGTEQTVHDLLDAVPVDVEGVTLLGGEPFEQPGALGVFAEQVRARGQSVMTFSGYTVAQLQSRAQTDAGVARLLAATDLLVDGPFDRNQIDRERPWVGSRNQGFHALSSRYDALVNRWHESPDLLEVRVLPSGQVEINGWAETRDIEDLLDGLRLNGRIGTPTGRTASVLS